MTDLFSVTDRVVVVTGGLGQLGRQFSRALLDRGACVAVLDRPSDDSVVADRLGTWPTERFMFVPADVVDRHSVEAALTRVAAVWGPPNGLINNAAIDSPPGASDEENGPLESYPETSWDRVMDVNVKGVLHCCQAVGARMAAAGRGSIINIGSIYGLVSPDQRIYQYRWTEQTQFFKPIAYSASKSALLNMTRYMATYWAPQNVRVNSLSFGGVFNSQDPQFLEGYAARVPLGRMAREDEYNGAILFLLSEASSYMTGANLIVDGGWTAW